jgi:hypothetical protein
MTKAELKAKLKKEEELFDETTKKTREQVAQIEGLLNSQKTESASFIQNLVRKAKENIRANIYRVADSGVTDGDDLTKAFRDYQVQEFEIVNEGFIYFVNEKLSELADQMKELNKILKQEMGANFTAENFYKKQKLKWEKGMDAGFKIGGAVGGIAAAVAVTGVVTGALTTGALAGALAGSVVPVVGTIIGAVAGIFVGLAASFIGSKSKQFVTAERAREVKQQIAPVIDDLCGKMTDQLTDSFEAICKDVSAVLEEFCRDRMAEAKQNRTTNNTRILQDENTTGELLRELEDDLKYLTDLERRTNA